MSIENNAEASDDVGFVRITALPPTSISRQNRWNNIDAVLIVDWLSYDKMCANLFNKIVKRYKMTENIPLDILIGVEHGGTQPGGRLFMMLKAEFPNIVYTNWNKVTETANIDIKGKNVLVIDDMVTTGNTVRHVQDKCNDIGVGSFKFACLARKVPGFIPDFAAIDVEDRIGVFFPWKSWPVSIGYVYHKSEVE